MKIKLKKHKKQKSDVLETFDWKDVFYIVDLNDSEQPHREKYTVEQDGHWYNLRLKPNTIRPESAHYCIACGGRLDKMLECVSRHIGMYKSIYDYYESLDNLTDNGRCSPISKQYADEYWKEFGDSKYITQYEKDIEKAIEIGKDTTIIVGQNVSVTYNEKEKICKLKGAYAEWTQMMIVRFMTFKGHTKIDLYKKVMDEIDVDCLNEVFGALKAIGCYSIRDMKRLSEYRWVDVFVPLVNNWDFGTDDYYGNTDE